MTTNDDFSDHDHTADTASTPNAADLNAALPQLMSSSTTAFDAFDDLDINQTNFSELDEEEQDIAHIILSDPSLLGLDLLIGAGPPKSRAGESTSGATGNESSRQHGFRAPSPMVTASSTPFMDTSGDTYSNNQSSHLKQQSSTPAAQGATDDRPIRNLGFPRMAPSNGTNAQLVNGVRQRPPPDILSRSRADNTGGWSADSDGAPGGTRVGEGPRVESPPKPFVRPPTMRKACDLCHQAKQKCSGERPSCERCRVGGWPCHYAVRQRRRAPVSTNRSAVPPASSTAHHSSFARSVPPASALLSQRTVQSQRRIPPLTTTVPAAMAPGHRPVMPNVTHKVTTRPSLPPSSSITRQSPQAVAPIQAQAKNSGASVVQETATSATTQPRFRSIAGPIKAGMPNFGQFSANAFLAKKFPGIMPGAGTPIYSPGQLPYMSKAFATGSNTNDSMAGAPGQNNQGSPSNGSGQFSPKPGPKRPSKKRKAKNGSGIASAEAENDLNVMDGFGYLYGFQDAGSAAPGQSANASAYPYHGPVGWASTFNSENRVSATPTDANGSADQSHQHDGRATEQLISPEEYLRVIREDGHLADLDLDSHLAILAPPPKDDRLQRASSPSRTQASDDVLQDVASILDPQFTDHSKHYSIVKAENSGHPGIGSNGDAESVSNADDVLQLLQQEFAFSESINSGTQPNVPVNSNPTTEIRSANNGSIVDMHTALFSGNDHAAATNLAAFNDEIFNAPYPSHDPHRSEASSVYHDSGEARLPDFMMDDLTDFAAWSAQAERDFAASEASSQFGTNAHQSPINAFQNPFASKVPVDVTDLDELIQLNAQNDEEQFALDLAAMFNEPRETPHTSSHSTVGQSSVTEDVQMDGGMMNIQELELALQQHANMISTPNATAANHASLPHTQPKIEGPDTPQPEPWRRLSASKDASTDIPTFTGATPTSQARTPSTQHNALYPTCQHEVDIAQTLWALSHLHLPTITLSQLMPQLTRALEILVSLPTCVVCSANPAQTIPQLALLSRTCTTLLRPHPLTPSPLPLVIAGGRTTFTGLSPEIEVHIVDILWANWRSNALQKVFTDLERRVKEEGEKCKIKRQEEREVALSSGEGLEALDITTPEELRCDVMTLALERFRAKVR